VSYFNVDMFAPSPTVFPFYVASSTVAAGSAHSPGPRRKLDSQCDVSSGLHSQLDTRKRSATELSG